MQEKHHNKGETWFYVKYQINQRVESKEAEWIIKKKATFINIIIKLQHWPFPLFCYRMASKVTKPNRHYSVTDVSVK